MRFHAEGIGLWLRTVGNGFRVVQGFGVLGRGADMRVALAFNLTVLVGEGGGWGRGGDPSASRRAFPAGLGLTWPLVPEGKFCCWWSTA